MYLLINIYPYVQKYMGFYDFSPNTQIWLCVSVCVYACRGVGVGRSVFWLMGFWGKITSRKIPDLPTWYLFCLPRNKASADDKAEISSWVYSTDSAHI